VAASLPLGIFPSQALLAAFSLQHIFNPIIQSVKEGNFELLAKALYSDARKWLLHMGIWVPLKERLETLVWRVFIRKVYLTLARDDLIVDFFFTIFHCGLAIPTYTLQFH